MGVEIERKYLVDKEKWDTTFKEDSHLIRQGYIVSSPDKTIRVRLVDNTGYLTIKGRPTGASRPEFEYEIPQEDAKELLTSFCTTRLSKIRNRISYKGKVWEVDEFLDDNEGLIVAEIELSNEHDRFELPPWVTKDVTGDERYYSSSLSKNPYKGWQL